MQVIRRRIDTNLDNEHLLRFPNADKPQRQPIFVLFSNIPLDSRACVPMLVNYKLLNIVQVSYSHVDVTHSVNDHYI